MAINRIFKAGIFTHRAVTIIALDRYNLLSYLKHLIRCNEADHLAKLRIRIRVTMGHPHTAANRYIETNNLLILNDRNIPEILRVYINIIRRWNSDTDFEFTRQIHMPIDGLYRINCFAVWLIWIFKLLAIQPNFMIGWCSRSKVTSQFIGNMMNLLMHF